ncbi:MAG: AEC family transporter [Opitutaceae bacterium]|nr:AEC family transporter [Opitutaceae bacterium]
MNYVQLLTPDFTLILCGHLVCRFTGLNRTVWEQVDALVYYFLLPVLLFQSIVRNPLHIGAASNLMVSGLLLGITGVALVHALPRLPGIRRYIDSREHAAAAQVAFRFNSYIGLALAERIAGAQGVTLLALLMSVCVPLFNISAVWPMARYARRGVFGELARNPLIIGTVTGLAANLLGLTIPVWMEPTVTRIGAASLALGLMAAGASLQFQRLAHDKLLAILILSIRHLILPLVACGLARFFQLAPAEATVLLAFSALPSSSSSYVLAARMGYDGAYVAGLVTLSTVLATISLPFALGVLR